VTDDPLPPYGTDRETAIQLYVTKLQRTRDEAEIFVEGF
jgi:hypothetical protein